MTIQLNEKDLETLRHLKKEHFIIVKYKNLEGWIEPSENGNIIFEGRIYRFNFFEPEEINLKIKKI